MNVHAARLAVRALTCGNRFGLAHVDTFGGHSIVGQHLGHGLGTLLGQFRILVGRARGVDEA